MWSCVGDYYWLFVTFPMWFWRMINVDMMSEHLHRYLFCMSDNDDNNVLDVFLSSLFWRILRYFSFMLRQIWERPCLQWRSEGDPFHCPSLQGKSLFFHPWFRSGRFSSTPAFSCCLFADDKSNFTKILLLRMLWSDTQDLDWHIYWPYWVDWVWATVWPFQLRF